MLRFEPKDGKNYHRRRLNPLVFLILVGVVLWHDYSTKIKVLIPYSGTIRYLCYITIVGCGIYIALRLLELFSKRPELGGADYKDEYVELYEDHIEICEFASVVAKQKYDTAIIYYEDIDITRIRSDYMTIFIARKPSERTHISMAGYYDHRTFRVGIGRYPKELRELLQGSYKQYMKVV